MGSGTDQRPVTDAPLTGRAAYYRDRALEARAKAEAMTDYEARQTMLQVANMWETMAATANAHSHSN
jgi:hypothetical protein